MISTLLELWITQYKEYVRQKYASSYQCYRVVLWGQPFIAYTIRKWRNTHSGKSDRQWEFSYSRDFFMNAWIPPPLARSIRRNFKSFFSTRACVALRMEAHSCPGLIPLWGLHHFRVDSSEPATIYFFTNIILPFLCVGTCHVKWGVEKRDLEFYVFISEWTTEQICETTRRKSLCQVDSSFTFRDLSKNLEIELLI